MFLGEKSNRLSLEGTKSRLAFKCVSKLWLHKKSKLDTLASHQKVDLAFHAVVFFNLLYFDLHVIILVCYKLNTPKH